MADFINAVTPSSSPTVDLSNWTCNLGFYGDDVCDCNCGLPDPDCTPETTDFINCWDNEICVDGVCINIVPTESPTADPTGLNPTSDPTSYPTVDLSEWTCNIYFYGDDICDCNCGLPDPDCTPETTESINCDYNEVCLDGVCVSIVPTESPSTAPSSSAADDTSEWTCNIGNYGTDDGCHCNCGLHDPDCDLPDTRIINCEMGQICASGLCSTWFATNVPTSSQSVTSRPTGTQITSAPLKPDNEGFRDWLEPTNTAGILFIGTCLIVVLVLLARCYRTRSSHSTLGDTKPEITATELNYGSCGAESTEGINCVAHYALKQEA